jgi:hypothetical protein
MSQEQKPQIAETLSPEQTFVDSYSFAGYSNGALSGEGDPVFWDTRTFRGPGSVELADDIQGVDVEPRDGTYILVKSPTETNVLAFTGQGRALKVSEYKLEDISGASLVQLKNVTLLKSKPWSASVPIQPEGYAKVVNVGDVSSTPTAVQQYDALAISDEQQSEFTAMKNAVTAIEADRKILEEQH